MCLTLKHLLSLLFLIVLMNAFACGAFFSCSRVMYFSIHKLEKVGIIEIPLPPEDIKKTISLDVHLIIGGTLPTRYVGQVELAEPDKFKEPSGFQEDTKTVKFRVRFPVTKPLPFVKRISINNNVLCEEDLDIFSHFGPVLTRVKLQYTLQFSTRAQNDSSSSSVENDEAFYKNFSVNQNCGLSMFYPVNNELPKTKLDWPWLVGVYFRSQSAEKFLCSGTLVTANHVVMAAHCLLGYLNKKAVNESLMVNLRIIVDGSVSDSHPKDFREVLDTHIYPLAENLSSTPNIALLELSEAVLFSHDVKPVCLWRQIPSLSLLLDADGIVTLWDPAATSESHALNNPKFIHVTVKSSEHCNRKGLNSSSHSICTIAHSDFYICPNASVGELIIHQQDAHSTHLRWKLRGVIQHPFGIKSCTSSRHLVFTDIGMYADWFAQKLESSLF